MDAFGKLRGRLGQYIEQKKIAGEITALETQIATSPSDRTAIQRLAELYQIAGRMDDAINSLTTAAEMARAAEALEPALALYRKAERLASAERRIQVLRRMIPIHRDLKAYQQAFKFSREVIEYHLASNQQEVAVGFLKTLPKLGERDEAYRRELSEMFMLRDQGWSQGAGGTWRGRTGILPVSSTEEFADMCVLIVDDEQGQLKQLIAALQPLGCLLVTATDGIQALVRIAERRPSLIVSDLVMPRMDGSQLFEHLQNDPVTEAIPFVCLTSRDDEDEQAAALERGVEDYWLKPFRPKELRARVKRILRRVRHHAALSGNLVEMGVPDLLQMLEVNARTGSLLLETPGRSATIYLVEGRPIDAVTAGREGEEVVYLAVNWREGSFQFTPRLLDRPQKIFTSTQGLLLEAMRRMDEEREALERLPRDPQAELVIALEPGIEDLPEGASLQTLTRVRSLVDGMRPLSSILSELKGSLEAITLLADLYTRGFIKNLSPEPEPAYTPAPPEELPASLKSDSSMDFQYWMEET